VSFANSRAPRLCVHPFDPLSARCGSHKWIRKVLCFPRNLVVPEPHDAHGVGRLTVIRYDQFGDPEITSANDSSDGKPLFARLTRLARWPCMLRRLRVFQHRVLVIDAVLRFKIVGIGCRPMLIQRRTDLGISRSRTLFLRLLIVHLELFNLIKRYDSSSPAIHPSYELLFRGSSFALRYSSPSGPIAATCETYSPDFPQWKWGVLPGRMITAPGG
jgi:hypothetical protein